MNKNNPIGFVDSGVGGLTVIKEAQKQLPNEQFIFIGDTARMPYGPRPTEEVVRYTFQMANYLVEQKHIKLLVIACNTATARVLSQLQRTLAIPVIGVIQPGAWAATKTTKNNRIGIIATQGTVDSGAYDNEIHAFRDDVQITSQAEPEFVQLVESNKYHEAATRNIVSQHLEHMKSQDVDTLILGCTHFPLLAPFIEAAMGPQVTLIDAGRETVRVIQESLLMHDLYTSVAHSHSKDIYYTTGNTANFRIIATDWLDLPDALDVRHLNIVENDRQQYLEEQDGKTNFSQ